MRYIICLIAIIWVIALAWEPVKCTHVYTLVVGDTLSFGGIYLTTQQLGSDIICVKCFHETKQTVKYPGLGISLPVDSMPYRYVPYMPSGAQLKDSVSK